MDQAAKLFLVMLLASILIGAGIVVFNPRYRPEAILKTNAQYFPQVEIAAASTEVREPEPDEPLTSE